MNGMTPLQRADLAALLVSNVPPSMIRWLGERVLGREALVAEAEAPSNVSAKAKILIEAMHNAGRLPEAIAILKTESRNADLLFGLNHILSGATLATLPEVQRTIKDLLQPFLSNDFTEVYFPRVQRTVCAIGLGPPVNRLRGTGFLIAPDLVLTNFHVIDVYLTVQSADGEDIIREKVEGDNLYFFFDYLSAPCPLIPPDPARPHASELVRGVKQRWLVRASRHMDNEGVDPFPEDADGRFDYAVIRLEKPIGKLPCRKSGGTLRGWLPLDNGINVFDEMGARLVVLQHPGGAEQLWDIGVYDDIDPSKTRIRYRINSEPGASGGPAFDPKGRVYAIHNAVVKVGDNVPPTHNQGVRTDVILKDLKKKTGIDLPPVLDEDIGLWSLSDSVNEPRPIIGRTAFRQSVMKMTGVTALERVLTVTGSKDSGRRFSIDLLKRLLGTKVPVVRFTADDLMNLGPRAFIEALANELALTSISSIPSPIATESDARWVSAALPKWLGEKLAADQAEHPSRYPIWVVLEAVVPEGKRLAWAADLPDLLSALMGTPDTAPVPGLTQIRWLLLGASNTALPPTRSAAIIDDLAATNNTNFAEDFADCVSLGWRSVDRIDNRIPAQLLKNIATTFVADATRDNKPVRAYLASYVGRFIKGQ